MKPGDELLSRGFTEKQIEAIKTHFMEMIPDNDLGESADVRVAATAPNVDSYYKDRVTPPPDANFTNLPGVFPSLIGNDDFWVKVTGGNVLKAYRDSNDRDFPVELVDIDDPAEGALYYRVNISGASGGMEERVDPIGGVPTVSDDVASNIARIAALENSSVSPNESQSVHDFHAGLEEEHMAGAVIRVSPYNLITRLKLKDTTAITGDSGGIEETELTDDELLRYSGFSNDIYKVIVLQNINKTAGQTEDIISYTPTSRTSPHHLLRVESDNTYVIGNPHPTSGGSDNDHTIVRF